MWPDSSGRPFGYSSTGQRTVELASRKLWGRLRCRPAGYGAGHAVVEISRASWARWRSSKTMARSEEMNKATSAAASHRAGANPRRLPWLCARFCMFLAHLLDHAGGTRVRKPRSSPRRGRWFPAPMGVGHREAFGGATTADCTYLISTELNPAVRSKWRPYPEWWTPLPGATRRLMPRDHWAGTKRLGPHRRSPEREAYPSPCGPLRAWMRR